MKRYFLYNTFLLLFAMVMFLFFRNQGYFVSLIMKNDIIYYAAVLPAYLLVSIFGISYQFFGISKNDTKADLGIKILSICVSVYLMLMLMLQTRIYVTTGDGLLIVLMAIPAALIITGATFLVINNKRKATA